MRSKALRLTVFALLTSTAIGLAINAFLAWRYVHALTDPGCHPQPGLSSDTFGIEEIWLETRDGLRLRAWYFPPENGAVVIALGGTTGSLGNNLPAVGFLLREGYGVLQIDSRACADPPAPVTLGGKEILEVQAGIEFLQSREEVRSFGAFGFSMGGVTAIRSAARYPEIRAVAADGGYFNLGDDFTEPGMPKTPLRSLFLYHVAAVFWLQSGMNPWQISPIDDLRLLSPRPVLFIYGEYEAENGRAQAQYEAARQPKWLWIVPGSAHGENYATAPEEYERRVLELFDQALLR